MSLICYRFIGNSTFLLCYKLHKGQQRNMNSKRQHSMGFDFYTFRLMPHEKRKG